MWKALSRLEVFGRVVYQAINHRDSQLLHSDVVNLAIWQELPLMLSDSIAMN